MRLGRGKKTKGASGGKEDVDPQWPAVAVTDELGNSQAVLPEWPVAVPITITIPHVFLPGQSEGQPIAMFIVLDLEKVPGLTEAVERHRGGESLDVKSVWVTLSPEKDPSDPAIALLALQLPELDLNFFVSIDVDSYSKELMVAAQTDRVSLIDQEAHRHLHSQDLVGAMKQGREIGFRVKDPDPLLQILLQRREIPPKGPTEETDEEFVEQAKEAHVTALLTGAGAAPVVLLFDPDVEVENLRTRLGSQPYCVGSWRAKVTEDGPIARIDCDVAGERIGSWFITAPPPELLSASAVDGHGVFIVDQPAAEGEEEGEVLARARDGVPIFADISPPSMRAIADGANPS